MNHIRTHDVGVRFLIIAASLIVLIAGLKAASALILPFLTSVFVAMISLPLLNWLRTKRVPSPAAVLLTILTDVSVLVGLALFVGGSIKDFAVVAPQYQEKLETMAGSSVEWLREQGIDVTQAISLDLINPGIALDIVSTTLRGATAVLSNFVLVFLTIVFILFEAAGLRRKLELAFGKQAKSSDRFDRIGQEIQQYLGIKTLISLLTGVIIAVSLAILGIDFPILWGLLAFLLNYIPNLGSILASVPPILLTIVQLGPGRALAVAGVFAATNILLGNVVEPHFMGQRLGLSTLVVFLSLVFWGWVWGPVGMLLSVPLTMIVKIMLENSEEFRWVAVLLEANPKARR